MKEFFNGRMSINTDPKSPYWFVTFEGADGRMKRRSTKVPVKGGMFEGVKITAKLAEKLAYQRGAQIANAEAKEKSADSVTVRAWCDAYVQRRAPLLRPKSVGTYKSALRTFYAFLGKRADEPIARITKMDAKKYVVHCRQEVRAGSTERRLRCIAPAFNDAVDAEIIRTNPFSRVQVPPDTASEKLRREAFTMEEMRYMIDNFPPEWSSAVRCSFETYGQRLGDILALGWEHFDWENRVVRIRTSKTGRQLTQPMRPEFYSWARSRWEDEGSPASGLLHPELAASSSVSYQFGLLLQSHKIGTRSPKLAGARTPSNSKTFHCIRATVATQLQTSGISQGIAMELVGHGSTAIHQAYIRPSAVQLADAASKLPALSP